MGAKTAIIVTIIIVIIIILSVLAIFAYNTLAKLQNDMKIDWEELKKIIDKRFALAIKALNTNGDNQDLINLINRESKTTDMVSVMNNSIELEKMLPSLKLNQEEMNAFNINREQVLKAKEKYNNDCLKYDGKIKSFPIIFVAIPCGFKKWIYFRSEN